MKKNLNGLGENVVFRVLFPQRQEQYQEGKLERFSYGGLLVRSSKELNVGTLIELQLQLQKPAPSRLKLLGEVKWTKKLENTEECLMCVFYLLPTYGRLFKIFISRNFEIFENS